MVKCTICRSIFDESGSAVKSDRHGFRYGPAETYNACPICGATDLAEVVRCRVCGEYHADYDMHGQICDECVSAEINYETFLDFSTSGAKYDDEPDILEDFIFRSVFDVTPTAQSSYEMKQVFREVYIQRANNEKLLKNTEFLRSIYDYMTGRVIRDEFAEWLEERMNKDVH